MPLTCFKSSAICKKNTERVLLQDNSVWPSSFPRQQWQQLPAFLQGPAPDLLGDLHLIPALSLPGSCQAFMWVTKWCLPWIHQLCGGNFALQVPVSVLALLCPHCDMFLCFNWVEMSSPRKSEMVLLLCTLFGFMEQKFPKGKHGENQISSVERNNEIQKVQVS